MRSVVEKLGNVSAINFHIALNFTVLFIKKTFDENSKTEFISLQVSNNSINQEACLKLSITIVVAFAYKCFLCINFVLDVRQTHLNNTRRPFIYVVEMRCNFKEPSRFDLWDSTNKLLERKDKFRIYDPFWCAINQFRVSMNVNFVNIIFDAYVSSYGSIIRNLKIDN